MNINNSVFSLQKRLLAIFVLITFVFIAIVCKLFYIQILSNSSLKIKAMEQWARDLPLSAIRGNITDRNSVILATNYSTYDVYVRPSMVDNPSETTRKLCKILGLDFDDTYKKVINYNVSEVSIKLQVEDGIANKLIKENLSGVLLSENSKRYYPYNDLLTQVLGFTTIDNVGQAGIEAYYDRYLQGLDGYILQQSDVKGVKIDNTLVTYVPSIQGATVELTIDVNIQSFTENALTKLMQEQNPTRASISVINCKTGEILAMACKPSFDLNNVPRDDVSALMETIKNFNIVDVYEPGSTFKVLTMSYALETGNAHLSDRFYDPGYRIVDGEKIKCWKLKGHGSQTLSEGLCNSCNSVFVDLALRLGKDGIYEMFKTFNLGNTLGVDFLGESGGIIMNYDSAKTVDIARMGFGQAIAVTPLQELYAINSCVNGGNLLKPYFVKSITSSDGVKIFENQPTILKQTISSETSAIMRTMFEDVVKQFSGFNTFIPGYRVGGKTGTTQKYKNGVISGDYIASFVGGFPADDPEYMVLVVVDEPKGDSYYGSIVATPYAKLIFEDIIKYKNILPKNLDADLKKVDTTVSMPNVIGKRIDDAILILEDAGLQVEIDGENEMVKGQLVPTGTMLSKNSIVLLYT